MMNDVISQPEIHSSDHLVYINPIPYARRPNLFRHDIECVLPISDSTHKVSLGDSLASRLTLTGGGEKFGVIYLRERGSWR